MTDLRIRPEAIDAATVAIHCGVDHKIDLLRKDDARFVAQLAIAEFCRVEGLTVETRKRQIPLNPPTCSFEDRKQQRLVGKWRFAVAGDEDEEQARVEAEAQAREP